VQASVANVQGITKIVLTLSAPVDYNIVKERGAYLVRFKSPIQPPFGEQPVEDAAVSRLTFTGNELRIQLTAPDIVADAYQLENPSRIVLDLRKAAAPIPGVLPNVPGARPQHVPGIRTIVIDPGHGGKEVGAVGANGLMEKDVTLTIARKLAASLSNRTGARVVLTRDEDAQVSLDQRTALANQYQADLFLSVHMNAAVVKDAKGSETYFLSLEASDELARKAAETENAASGGAADPSSDLKMILWDLAQQSYIDESSRFAQSIQEEMNAATGVANRGVKQAPFKVLVGATMPAALAEISFVTNPQEARLLKNNAYRQKIAEALFSAIRKYQGTLKNATTLATPQ
jgi:N-acetylmuramoyl-L-alanine amidase